VPAGGLDPATTAVIVLGASDWPAAKQFEPAVQFANSAHKFIEFLLAPNGFNLDPQHLLDLFDSDDEQPRIIRRIDEFLARAALDSDQSGLSLTDVITFYVGHGGFDAGPNSAYFLSIRKTNPIDYLGSSLSVASLRRALREHARAARHYLILDCCFAAAAVAPYLQMSATAQAAVTQVRESFPSSGTALLCAAGARVPARAKRDANYTMFSEGLLDILRVGVPGAPGWLTIRDLADNIRDLLRTRYADEAARPEVHCPEQAKGSVADIPLFRNPAVFVPELRSAGNSSPPPPAERPRNRQAAPRKRRSSSKPNASLNAVTLRISAPPGSKWIFMDRSVEVFLDGKSMGKGGSVKQGVDITISTDNGNHEILVRHTAPFGVWRTRRYVIGVQPGKYWFDIHYEKWGNYSKDFALRSFQ
jgi:hypothetical protein